MILAGAGLVVLARAGVIGWPSGADGLLAPLTWLIAGLLIVNTLGNLASRSRFERTVFARGDGNPLGAVRLCRACRQRARRIGARPGLRQPARRARAPWGR